ncbi:ABC transporter ATP-binding protein [Ahrensia sp. R2A130]|uniref:ABC transporter ATP-binding protein n=1 Tax=Ahrensia sp. R2A130 TaxID=744979 RepID=UPI0001E0A458|nr:dipeptide ABC transporter ATP-binding protein [Ahrensia sp. R2A130]EFL90672.1 ABC transporter ATP-binding protein [Ahrensia sp. R2A130]
MSLTINDLHLSIGGSKILSGISLEAKPGRTLGIVGESGSGKSMTALSVMQLLPLGSHTTGSINFAEHDLLNAPDELMQDLRGDDIAMIFQEPMTALNPVHTIGDQIAEGICLHTGASKSEAHRQAAKLMADVGLPVERFPLGRFPHQLSGGQRQRVAIAMACAQSPDLLIADEPTTALDVVLQAQILDLLRARVENSGMALMLITHDLAVVADMADDLIVMREGEIVDHGPTKSVLRSLAHPYTAKLAAASTHRPALKPANVALVAAPIVQVQNITRDYSTPRQSLFQKGKPFRAVDDVSFNIRAGESLGLVGASGCGKSTLAKMILALDKPTNGSILINSTDIATADQAAMRPVRCAVQAVFQDPGSSFDPRHTVERLIAEPLHLEPKLSADERRQRVLDALAEVAMPADSLHRYPHEFSGGQRQRLALARALITRPSLIVADEPVSALDVSIRAQILDLIADLRHRLGIAWLFISHDLGVVRAICDEVMVMDAGRIVERGACNSVFDAPQSNAAKALVAATPDLARAIALAENDA